MSVWLWSQIYQLVLRFFPFAFRRRFGAAMIAAFEDRFRNETGPSRHLDAARACGDAIVSGLLEHRAARARSRAHVGRTHTTRAPGGLMESLAIDLRHAVRNLVKRPSFTVLAVATLAVGIGSNAAIFSVVDAVLLNPLPFPEANRLVIPWASNPELARQVGFPDTLPLSAGGFYDLEEGVEGLESVAMMRAARLNLTGDGDPEQIFATLVTGEFFRVLRQEALAGRALTSEDDTQGPRVAVLSNGFWQSRYASDPDVIGRAVSLDGIDAVIVGVMPPEFTFPRGRDLPAGFGFAPETQMWLPMQLGDAAREARGTRAFAPVGRLRDGWSIAQLQSELDALSARVAEIYPDTDAGWGFRADPLREQIVGDVRPSLIVLLSAVGLVTLIACANVANLVLARALERQREVAVKTAMGATGWRLLRELITESLALTTAAGAFGMLLASWLLSLTPHIPIDLPYMGAMELRAKAVLFTLVLSVTTGLVLGLLPRVIVAPDSPALLKDGARTRGARRGRLVRGALVVGEVAIASVLLVCAGLLLKSFLRLVAVDPGFRVGDALTFEVSLPPTDYDTAARVAFFRDLRERLAALPGVAAVGAVSNLPMSGTENLSGYLIEGRPEPEPDESVLADVRVATPGYFETMGITLLAGRSLRSGDDGETSRVAVIDETMARLAWPEGPVENAIGKRFTTGTSFDDEEDEWATVVGVVRHVRHSGLHLEARPQIYWPHAQEPSNAMGLVVRTERERDPLGLANEARRAVFDIEPMQPVSNVQTLAALVSHSSATRRFSMLLLGAFAAVALALSALGIYGVTAYSVGLRTSEMGLRMALGARPNDVLSLVLREALIRVAAGMALGLTGALMLTRLLASLLFHVTPLDPATFGAAFAVLLLIATLAVVLPGRRATRVDPTVALRWE